MDERPRPKCLAGTDDVVQPTRRERAALARMIARLKSARALPRLEDAERELLDALIEGKRHRLGTGCFCLHAEAEEFARALRAAGVIAKPSRSRGQTA